MVRVWKTRGGVMGVHARMRLVQPKANGVAVDARAHAPFAVPASRSAAVGAPLGEDALGQYIVVGIVGATCGLMSPGYVGHLNTYQHRCSCHT